MSGGRATALLLLALVCAPGCGREPTARSADDDRIPVRVHEALRRDLARAITLTGRLRASESVEIQPKVGGRIIAFRHDEGDTVEAGDTVAELDPTEYRLQLERAEAAVAQAEARREEAERAHSRTRELFEQHVLSQAALDTAEVEKRIARADVRTARANRNLAAQRLEDTRVIAPIAGVLQDRGYSVGDIVGASFGGGSDRDASRQSGDGGLRAGGARPLFALIQLDPLQIEFNVAEQDVRYVHHSDLPISLQIDVYPDREWVGYVDYIAPSLHPSAHTQLIRVRVANPDRLLKPGMFVRMVGTREVAEDTLVIRADSLVNLGGSYGAYVVNGDGTARLQRLEIAFVTENQAAVRGGLEAGDRVVFEGQSNLRDGAAVRIVGTEAPAVEPATTPALPEGSAGR